MQLVDATAQFHIVHGIFLRNSAVNFENVDGSIYEAATANLYRLCDLTFDPIPKECGSLASDLQKYFSKAQTAFQNAVAPFAFFEDTYHFTKNRFIVGL